MTVSYDDFKASVLGKAIDVDGAYGAQCVDLFDYFCRVQGIPYPLCNVTGYAQDIWTQREYNGILKHFDEVSLMKPGDVAVFKPYTAETWYSHIAFYDHDAGGGYGWFLGQNQGETRAASLIKLPYADTYPTALRFKAYEGKEPAPHAVKNPTRINWVKEDGIAWFHRDSILIHKDSPDGPVIPGVSYNHGQHVQYFEKCAYKGHRWVKYYRASGGIGVVAVSGSETHGVDPWATFTAVK